jgi:tellurite resistance protein TerC
MKETLRITYQLARRIVIALLGSTILLLGLAMIILPGPAVVVIPMGLAILSLEFAWARHWLKKFKDGANQAFNNFKDRRTKQNPPFKRWRSNPWLNSTEIDPPKDP